MKIKANRWKIGTSIFSYIDEFMKMIKGIENPHTITLLAKGKDHFGFAINGTEYTEKYQKTKCRQMLSTFITCGYITPNKKITHNSDFFKVDYTILPGESDYFTTAAVRTANRLKTCYEIDQKPLYPSDHDMLFSIMLTYLNLAKDSKKSLNDLLLLIEESDVKSFAKYYTKYAQKALNIDTVSSIISQINKAHALTIKPNVFTVDLSGTKPVVDNTLKALAEKEAKLMMTSNTYTLGYYISDHLSSGHFLNIPVFQREYRWNEELLTSLLFDIKNIDNYHYIGNVIVQKQSTSNGTKIKLLDGQQRITTMLLIVIATRWVCLKNGYPIPAYIDRLFEEDKINNIFKRVKGNADFNQFFNIVKNDINEKLVKESIMVRNFYFATKWVESNFKNENEMKDFWTKLLNKVIFIQIVDAKSDPYLLFEKLNTGSEPLNTIELIKNSLLSNYEISEEDEEDFQELFTTEILNLLKNKKGEIDHKLVDDFINFELRANDFSLTKGNNSMFKSYDSFIRNSFDKNSKYKDVITSISKSIKWFLNITDYDEYRLPSAHLYKFADILAVLNLRTVYAPLIKKIISLKLTDDIEEIKKCSIDKINDVREILSAIEKFEVRLQVANYRGQSLSEKIIKVIEDVNENVTYESLLKKMSGTEDIKDMPSMDDFITSLKNGKHQNKPATIVMFRIENWLNTNRSWKISKDHTWKCLYDKYPTREHLLPRKFNENWHNDLKKWIEEYEPSDVEEIVDRIGNAFPIPGWKNSKFKNASLHDKLNVDEKETVKLKNLGVVKFSREVDGKEENIWPDMKDKFTPEIIEERCEIISNIASEIWKD